MAEYPYRRLRQGRGIQDLHCHDLVGEPDREGAEALIRARPDQHDLVCQGCLPRPPLEAHGVGNVAACPTAKPHEELVGLLPSPSIRDQRPDRQFAAFPAGRAGENEDARPVAAYRRSEDGITCGAPGQVMNHA
jgi:hypothetical protein